MSDMLNEKFEKIVEEEICKEIQKELNKVKVPYKVLYRINEFSDTYYYSGEVREITFYANNEEDAKEILVDYINAQLEKFKFNNCEPEVLEVQEDFKEQIVSHFLKN